MKTKAGGLVKFESVLFNFFRNKVEKFCDQARGADDWN